MLSWRLQSGTNLEPFSRDNLFISVYDSLKHRKTALQDASSLTDTVISQCLPRVMNGALNRNDLVMAASTVLEHFDKVAATHYRAFHPISS